MNCGPSRDKIIKMNQLAADIGNCERYLEKFKDRKNLSDSRKAKIAKVEAGLDKKILKLKTIAKDFSFLSTSIRLVLYRYNNDVLYDSCNIEIDPYPLSLFIPFPLAWCSCSAKTKCRLRNTAYWVS
uniref:AsIV-cont00006-ORF2 n=1 Tax=Apophua simplicipes ichnovirus TaxID=1329648 RepID=S5DR19_9VIRU|nr:AsIV-cont00006-ORF2 [Apophua simplicipes ichnovirus]